MGQPCSVCNHHKRLEIDRLLVSNRSLASVTRQYGVSVGSLSHHRKNHLSRQMVKAKEVRDIFVSKNILGIVDDLLNISLNILKKTENKPKQYGIALKAIAESRRTIEFLYECSISYKEIQAEEQRREKEQRSQHYDLNRLTVEEVVTYRDLLLKMQGKEQGRRTDLERKARRKVIVDRHRAKKRREKEFSPKERTLLDKNDTTPLKRVKVDDEKRYSPLRGEIPLSKSNKVKPEKPVNEFDQMRKKLNMPNHPEPVQSDSWLSS